MSETRQSRFQFWVALSCVAIILFFAAAEVLHTDRDSGAPSGSTVCLLCVSAHSSIATLQVHAAPTLANVELLASPLPSDVHLSFPRSSIFIRPPPAA